MKTLLWVSLLLLGFNCGLQAQPGELSFQSAKALGQSTNVTLYSLDPSAPGPRTNSFGFFHRWRILGRTVLTSEQAKSVAASLEADIKKGAKGGMAKKCFNPRHGLRLISGNQHYDFVICYECSRLAIFTPGSETELLILDGSPDKMNAILTAAGIPLGKS